MTASFSTTGSATTYSPLIVTDYTAARSSQTVINWVLGKASPDVTLMPGRLRSGTLVPIFGLESTARSFVDWQSGALVFAFADTDAPTTAMSYVVSGDLSLTQADNGRFWAVSVPYQEVSA